MAQIVYRSRSVFDATRACNVQATEFELREDVDLDSVDWKKRAEEIQCHLHSLLGNLDRLEALQRETKEAEFRLRSVLSSLELAMKIYDESRQFLVAQGLGSKMPDFPFDLESFLRELDRSKKLLSPG